MDEEKIETHPIQSSDPPVRMPKSVTMAAYEVYCEVFAPQEAIITGGCRGGFGIGELIAFLYARSFPRNEWRKRSDEVFKGMERRR